MAALAIALAGGHAIHGQQPTFRAQVELVEIDAIVTDASGNPVEGLTAADFEIVENGKPQAVAAFSAVNIPIERDDRPLYSPTAIEPDVLTNQGAPGRMYLIVLDDFSSLLALRTRHFMRGFIERHLGANDVAAIAYLGTGAEHSQEFTSSKRVLLRAMERFGGGIPGGPEPAMVPCRVPQPNPQVDFAIRRAMKNFRDIAEFMVKVPGQRKAILLISTGQIMDDLACVADYNGGVMSKSMDDAHAAMQAASRGHVAIYPIDPRGLTAEGGDAEGLGAGDPEVQYQTSLLRQQALMNLRMIADVTGGFAFVNQNTYDAAFTRLVRENSSYYVLGYYTANDARDGRFRNVRVRVTRPGLEVRARTGYMAPKGKAVVERAAAPSKNVSAATSAALASAIPSRGIPLRMSAAAYKGSGKEASIALTIGIDITTLDLLEQNGAFSGRLELALAATGSKGTTIGSKHHQVALALKPETLARARAEGMQMLAALKLPPGRYQIRAAVGDRDARAGSVIYDIEVPDFSKEPLMMSGVSMTSSAAARTLAVIAEDPLRDFLPGPATTAREFASTDTISLFAEVYDNIKRSPAHTVNLTATLRADDGRVLATVSGQRSSSELKGAAGGFLFNADLPLAGVAPGRYVVHVEARANAGDRPLVARDVMITVR